MAGLAGGNWPFRECGPWPLGYPGPRYGPGRYRVGMPGQWPGHPMLPGGGGSSAVTDARLSMGSTYLQPTSLKLRTRAFHFSPPPFHDLGPWGLGSGQDPSCRAGRPPRPGARQDREANWVRRGMRARLAESVTVVEASHTERSLRAQAPLRWHLHDRICVSGSRFVGIFRLQREIPFP